MASAKLRAMKDYGRQNLQYQASRDNAWEVGRNNAIDIAQRVTNRKPQPYTGERVAPLSDNERMALDKAATGYDRAQTYFSRAGQTLDEAATSQFDTDTRARYMQPYLENVTGKALAKESEAFGKEQQRIQARAPMMNALDSESQSFMEAQNLGQHRRTVDEMTAEGNSRAFADSFSRWANDKEMKMQTARRYQSVGGDIAQLNSDEIQHLMQTGGADRVLRQLTDDVKYSAFIEERDWDVNNLDVLLRTLSGTHDKAPSIAPKSNSAAQLVGTVAAMVGYFGKQQDTPKSYGGTGYGGGAGSGYAGGDPGTWNA